MPMDDDHDEAAPLRWGGLAWRAAAVAVIVAGIAGFIVAVHGTGGTDGSAAASDGADGADKATIATAVKRSVDVFGHAGDGKPWTRMLNPNRQGAPLTFLVQKKRTGWVKVLLPTRPNGATGWIRTSDVGLSTTDYRLDVSLH